MFTMYLTLCLGILFIYLIYKHKKSAENETQIPTYRCHTCDEEDCICTLDEETDDK